jgi:hypothetical protein
VRRACSRGKYAAGENVTCRGEGIMRLCGCGDEEAKKRGAEAEKQKVESALFSDPRTAALEIEKRLNEAVTLQNGVLIVLPSLR